MNFRNHKYYKRLEKLKKDKKGAMAIEIMIGMIAFIIVLCFLADLLILSWKFYVISETNKFVARTAGLQGGFLTSAPEGYPGGKEAYINSNQLRKKLIEDFDSAGIEEGDYDVSVNGYSLINGNGTNDIDYMKEIDTSVEVTYKWDLSSNFIPGSISQKISSKRSTLSEFKYRYDVWDGEQLP